MRYVFSFVSLFLFCTTSAEAQVCKGYGPQTPRDISQKTGKNNVKFNFAPSYKEMNLCNIHFHKNSEHKGPEFSLSGGKGKWGGFKCNKTSDLTKAELRAPKNINCDNIAPGDTIELHWVHSSCNVKPGPGLGSCLSDSCANPQLRVETQVYLLVNDRKAVDLNKLGPKKRKVNGYYQAKKIPTGESAVEFLGSTTGPKYTEKKCSPLQVTWNVSPSCQKMDIRSVHRFCKKNIFDEKAAHAVRQLVTNPKLLSKIK